MKLIPLTTAVCGLFLTSFAWAGTPLFTKILCKDYDDRTVTITNLGSDELHLSNSSYVGDRVIPRMTTGDCEGRKTYCSQHGQWMINIPETLAAGRSAKGHIWENGDVDDRPENHRLGDRYECVAVK